MVAVAVVLLSLAFAPAASAYLYWTNLNTNSIGRANLDGTGVNANFITFPPPDISVYPWGLAVDAQHLYWASLGNSGGTEIGRANLDGTGVSPAFINGARPVSVAVNGQYIYWTNIYPNTLDDTIGRANLDGSGVNQSFIAIPGGGDAVAVDSSYIYWAEGNGIDRANLDGSGVDTSFMSVPSGPLSLAVDGQHIYWGNSSNASIGRANLDGTGVNQTFVTTAGPPEGVAVDGQHLYWSNDDDTIGRANLDGTGVNNTFVTGAGQAVGLAVDAGGGSGGGGGAAGCQIPAPNASPTDCGPGTLATPIVQGTTWGHSCSSDAGCFPVALGYTLRGSMTYEAYAVGQPPWAFWNIKSLAASLVINGGQQNGWGIVVVPGVAPSLVENWQQLPCIGNGAPNPILPGVIPTVPSTISNPADSVIARNGPVNYSLYDPLLAVTALGAPEYDYENGINLFSINPIFTGLSSPGCSAAAAAAGAPRPSSDLVRSRPSFGGRVPRLDRLDQTLSAARAPRVPRVVVDGRLLSASSLRRAIAALAKHHPRLSARTLARQAVAIAVLDVLLNRQASDSRPVSHASLVATLNGLVAAYDRDPAAAQKAGVHIPQGESAHQFFFSRRLLDGYRALLTLGSVRNAIVRGAASPQVRRDRYARWLRSALRQHRVKISGLPRFSLPSALPLGVS